MTKEQARKAKAEKSHAFAVSMAARVPGPRPDWDGLKPGEHPRLPLKPPGKAR